MKLANGWGCRRSGPVRGCWVYYRDGRVVTWMTPMLISELRGHPELVKIWLETLGLPIPFLAFAAEAVE